MKQGKRVTIIPFGTKHNIGRAAGFTTGLLTVAAEKHNWSVGFSFTHGEVSRFITRRIARLRGDSLVTMPTKLGQWLVQQRSSTRIAYVFQMFARVANALLSFVWTPLLIGAMGKTLYGTFLSFQSVATLGSLGDLGMGGAINIETSRLLGRNDISGLQKFLSVARAAFAGMALAVMLLFVSLAPWLPQWLHFQPADRTGSMPLLFVVGGLGAALIIISSYITNLNYGAVTLTWPIIPAFLAFQLSLLAHWLLASAAAPLWIQYLPYLATTGFAIVVGWAFVRRSHPQLGLVFPLIFDRAVFAEIIGKSFWVYLYCIGGTVYIITDRLVINAGFGPTQVPPYQLNFKLCELALFVIGSAGFVSIPKIAVWIASPDAETRQRGAAETARLNRFQTFLGCTAVLVYIAINDRFMRWWLGPDFQVPLAWQAAFAATMGVMAAGYAGYDVVARCGPAGLRFGALTVAVGVLIKVGISYLAMKQQSIFLIALSTVVAQSLVVLACGWYASRKIGASWWRLAGTGWLVSLALVGFAIFWKASWWGKGSGGKIGFAVAAVMLLSVTAKIIGISSRDLRAEWAALRSILGK